MSQRKAICVARPGSRSGPAALQARSPPDMPVGDAVHSRWLRLRAAIAFLPDENDHHQREDEGDLELDAENEARHVFESAETEPGGDHARDIADTRHHHDHEGAHRVGEPQIGMDRPCHDGEAARRAAKRRVEPIGHGKDAIRVDAENARGARVLRRGADRLSEPCLAQKEPERHRPDREPESGGA